MITVNFFIDAGGQLLGFEVGGHADYDDIGKDVVCAAVSSAAYLVANTISDIIKVNATIHVLPSGAMYLKIDPSSAALCRDILLGLKLHMLGLEEQYPRNINVNYTEV